MPIYEYNCKKCGVFEVTQRITESPLAECPTCGSPVSRLISHTSFVLKGSGWYATDYARSNGGNKSDSSSPESAAKSDSSTKSESASSPSDSSSGSSSDSSKSTGEKSAASKAD
jgi:putative FmdB family regulatory protein